MRRLFLRLLSVFRSFPSLNSWSLDVKLGGRMLIKYPGLALIGGFGIAVAVGIAAGGFSVIYGNFLAPSLPFEEGDRIVSIEMWDLAATKPERRILHDYQVWREELKSVQELGAFTTITPNWIASDAKPESVRVASMTASGFTVARVAPLIGRYLTEDDERDGAPPVVVIGENVWRTRFAADPAILGRTIQLGATAHTIVGVMPEGFAFPVNHRFWTPLRVGSARPEPLTGPDLMVFGRLAPAATLESAQAEFETIGRRAALASPKIYEQLRPRVMPYANPFMGLHETKDVAGLHLMQGIVSWMLVLVCLNVAILVYSRTATRQSEITIRTALGAGRGRIVAQLFIEALVLSGVAALSGVAVAEFALRRIAGATLPIASELPFWVSFHLSPGSVLYAGALSVLAAAIVGIVPALQATGRQVQAGVRLIGAGGSGMRLGTTWTVLIVAQVGFAVALLPAAVSSAWASMQSGFADPGFAAEEFLTAQLGMDDAQLGVDSASTDIVTDEASEFTRRFADRQSELMRRLEAEPQVSAVTFAMVNPGEERPALIETESEVRPVSRPVVRREEAKSGSPKAARSPSTNPSTSPSTKAPTSSPTNQRTSLARTNRVHINFFQTFDVPILAGRGFQASDIPTAPAGPTELNAASSSSAGPASSPNPQGGAIIVNLPLAQQLFNGNALGRRIRYVDNTRRDNTRRDNTSAANTRAQAAPRTEEPAPWYEIVGIVPDFPTGASPEMDAPEPKVYHPAAPGQVHPATLGLRLRGDAPVTFAARLREIAAAVAPELHLRNILPLDEALRREQWIRRLEAATLLAVTISVLLLSAAGIYALMSITVSQRRKEIGIRMALGADRTRIVANIFSRAIGQLAVGASLGAALGAALEKASGGTLMRGDAVVVLPVVVLLMMAVGFVAAVGPARRSLRIAPTEALREQ